MCKYYNVLNIITLPKGINRILLRCIYIQGGTMLPVNYDVIKPNPVLPTYRRLFFLWLFLLIFFLLFIILMLILSISLFPPGSRFSQFLSGISVYIVPFLCFISSFISNIWQRRYWEQIEQRRFAAIRGNRALLAVEQPVANPFALQLPCTIKSRPGKGGILFIIAISLIVALLLVGLPSWLNNNFLFFSSNRLYNFLILFAIAASVMTILLLVLFFSPIGTQKIVVTEQDLSVSAGGQKSTIRWEEARLFAVYNAFGAQKSGAVLTYELSSIRNIVRWSWVQRRDRFNMRLVPTIPLDEYNRQMQALNELIVARTGLPLSDLRTDPALN
jgi:hypothetical protein